MRLVLAAALLLSGMAGAVGQTYETRTTRSLDGNTIRTETPRSIITTVTGINGTITTTYERKPDGRYHPLGSSGYRPLGR